MAGLKDIKRRIKSVKNTKKITYAMKLVSAAKLKKAQDAVTASRDYTDALGKLLAQLMDEQGDDDFSHPLLEERSSVKRIRLLIAGGTRGLCGGYNTNINKRIDAAYKELGDKYPDVQIAPVVLGKKPVEHLHRKNVEVLKQYLDLPDSANEWPIEEVCRELEAGFIGGEFDECYLIYTRFKSAMSQTVMFERLLPMSSELDLSSKDDSTDEQVSAGGVLFEPSAQAVFDAIVPRILRTKVRQAGLDAKASEHGSRMVAMDSATTNAGDLIRKLTLTHNKLRQGAITGELLDIIGGANSAE